MSKFKLISFFASLLLLAACDHGGGSRSGAPADPGREGSDIGGVIKGTAYVPVEISGGQIHVAASSNYPVTIVNPPNVRFNVDTSKMSVPTITNALLEFGKAELSDLFDNNISVCGSSRNKKCGTAYIRMYTIGQNGAGIWNDAIKWGAPIYANRTGDPRLTVGLNAANAVIVQKFAIPANKNVVRIQDFPSPAYEMRADFTEAGAGSYSTTLVIEYGLLE